MPILTCQICELIDVYFFMFYNFRMTNKRVDNLFDLSKLSEASLRKYQVLKP